MNWVVEVYLGNELIEDTSTLRLTENANVQTNEQDAA